MDRQEWDERYQTADLVWSAAPNRFLVEEVGPLEPGSALDLACGEGRNAIWLAEQGWRVTGVDFSAVAVDKARRLAAERGVAVDWQVGSVEEYQPPPDGFDLVAVFYLQLPPAQRAEALARAASCVGPGGAILVVAHDRANLADGYGGPQAEELLTDASDVAATFRRSGLVVERAERVTRAVETDEGPREAIDTLVRARRPPGAP